VEKTANGSISAKKITFSASKLHDTILFLFGLSLNEKSPAFFHQVQSLTEKITSLFSFSSRYFFAQFVTQEDRRVTSERYSSSTVLSAGESLQLLWFCALCWTLQEHFTLDMVCVHRRRDG